MRKILVFIFGTTLILPVAAAAQISTPKIGVMNVLRAIVECTEGKQANEDFQKKFEARREELSKKQKELEALQQQLRSQSGTLNDETRAALAKNADVKTTELQRSQEDSEKEFNELRNQIFNRIGSKLAPLVQQYAKEKNFTLVLDSSAQTTQLSYIDPAIDITDDVIKRFDTLQASSGGSTPASKPPAAAPPKTPAPAAKPPAAAPKK
ncbi:MAG: OmpH family outer membrane protein [Acidobacteria bacterium]|nr:OmpH family outer membrane protein [Acidobacteriota bacterium]MCI0626204.1 OmpH family outer membrane protein [Acidobacteriota bacterium]MCI0718025.1 OmpH family outer membrane protein [Acidobacteriota bacterium]